MPDSIPLLIMALSAGVVSLAAVVVVALLANRDLRRERAKLLAEVRAERARVRQVISDAERLKKAVIGLNSALDICWNDHRPENRRPSEAHMKSITTWQRISSKAI